MSRTNQGGPKQHFSAELWADFVRGVAGESQSREIQAHIESGCAECGAAAGTFRAVTLLAVNDRTLVVPEEAVRAARALFKPVQDKGWMDELENVVAEMIASARNDWQLAGVRSLEDSVSDFVGDRVLFRAGDYSVDLKVDPPFAGGAGELVGQIANEQDPQESLEDVLVQMVEMGKTVGETATNRFGEFVMEYPARQNAVLRFALKNRGQRIEVPLRLPDRAEPKH